MIVQVNTQTSEITARELTAEEELEILSYVEPVVVPLSITMRQARLVLHNAGLLQAVNAGVASMSVEAQIEWEFASVVQRNSPLVATLAVALGLDSAALDNMFVAASALL